MSTELVKREPLDLEHVQRVAKLFLHSGFFADVKELSQACVKIMAGDELGISPIAAMTGIYIVKGRVSHSAFLMCGVINRAGFQHRVIENSDTVCSIEFYKNGEKLGESAFSVDDARRAGLGGDNWTKYPRNMRWSRALSNGARWFCASAFGGVTPYTPEELGASVDESGEPTELDVTPQVDDVSDELNQMLLEASN